MSVGNVLDKLIISSLVVMALGSCASQSPSQSGLTPDGQQLSTMEVSAPGEGRGADSANVGAGAALGMPSFYREPPADVQPENFIQKGSGRFVSEYAANRKKSKHVPEGDIRLNFNAADLNEFVRVVFEKILKKNYLIDPRLKGKVTLHTTNPIHEQSILPIVEMVLLQNNAALILHEGMYRIVPMQDAIGQVPSPRVGSRFSEGGAYAMQIVPLRFVSAVEMEKILTPMMPSGKVRVDEGRNLLILSGPRHRLEQMLDTVSIFDVDWAKGMSFGLFRLQYAAPQTLIPELEVLMGSNKSPLTGVVKLIPIERLNAILVTSSVPSYIDYMDRLISQFDQGVEGNPGQRLFVYRLKNSKADSLAAVLQQIYELNEDEEPGGAAPTATVSQLPPGERSNFSDAGRSFTRADSSPVSTGTGAAQAQAKDKPQATNTTPGFLVAGSSAQDTDLSTVANVNIIAEPDSNSLLIMASPQDYRGIETVIKQLDVPPRQVLIEANIAEVTLSDSLTYGIRWFLSRNASQLGLNAPVPAAAGGDGLTYAGFSSSEQLRSFIDLLASKTAVNFLSAPQIMVLDNQTASIRVGDQIPVTVRNTQGTGDGAAPVVSEVQFRDTGTLLSVTPRINAGGQITLEISQEVSLPGSEPSVGGGGNVAISQRTLDSSVVVQSGETVLLGGLILETKNESRSGIPYLMDIPILGYLFSSTSEVVFRTELLVMITPRVIESEAAMRAVIDEVRGRMKKAVDFGNSVESVEM